MTNTRTPGFATRAIHAGAAPDAATGARATPIYQTTAFVFDDADHAASLFNLQTYGYVYSRLTNPTVSVLEGRLASLEGGKGATCTASGHAAQLLALFPLMGPGLEIVAANRLYGGSVTQLGRAFQKFGWTTRFVDFDDLAAVRAAITPATRVLFCESLANPGGVITDLEPIAEIAHAAKVPLVVDNTMATPALCRPFEWGADIVCHSTTKFLSGHGNAMGGAVVDSGRFDWTAAGHFPSLADAEPAYHGLRFHETFGDMAYTVHGHAVGLRDLGAAMAPLNAFLTISGIETLPLRMERHCDNALAVAEYLASHSAVAWVNYAGLPSNPYHPRAQKYLGGRAGSVFTFGVKGGYAAGKAVVEGVQLFSHLANIGDTRSLVIHPASTTHRQLTEAQRVAAGAGDDVIRVSIGLETVADLLADLDQALSRAAA
ncbi:MAG: O-acetylhomoserine aminocarboxypropyltransferase [Alphaproteobacteria bacterium]|nr:MAG: O-acetylhomoserine aminocarboxypropyltransferase [Alphaproteobacteria bacterium]